MESLEESTNKFMKFYTQIKPMFTARMAWNKGEEEAERKRVKDFTKETYIEIGRQMKKKVGLNINPRDLGTLMKILTTYVNLTTSDVEIITDGERVAWQSPFDIEGSTHDCMLYLKIGLKMGYKIPEILDRAKKIYSKT